MLAMVLLGVCAAVFICAERLFPGRALPQSPGWYVRAVLLNGSQLLLVVVIATGWNQSAQGASLLALGGSMPVLVQGLAGWLVGTFVFYWWHRARHAHPVLWRAHQLHHSATRIETLTAFYKHPLEIAFNSLLSAVILFPVLGVELAAAAWFQLVAGFAKFFHHANLRTPRWTGYLLQRPEHHSVHHELGVHQFNFGDLTLWDRLFGTFMDVDQFSPRCGFSEGRETKLLQMLGFRDVNRKRW